VKISMFWWLLAMLVATPAFAMDSSAAMLPQGVYVDYDNAAKYLAKSSGRGSQFRQAINAALQKNPRNAAALTHRAYLFLDAGDLKRAKRDFDAATAAAEPGSDAERHVLWSRGWAAYDLGEYERRLDWQRAVSLHGGRPFWLPTASRCCTGPWTAGRRLAWYQTSRLQ
jgi:tetratricopeptide (TPR) repeat protein